MLSDQRRCSPPVSQPASKYAQSLRHRDYPATPSFFFFFFFLNMPHDKPVAPHWTDMCDDHNKAKLFMTPAMQPLWSGSAREFLREAFWDNNARTWSVGKGSAWCSAWFN